MKISCWNVRGLNGLLTQNKVASLFKQHDMALIGLLETKMKVDSIPSFMYTKFRH